MSLCNLRNWSNEEDTRSNRWGVGVLEGLRNDRSGEDSPDDSTLSTEADTYSQMSSNELYDLIERYASLSLKREIGNRRTKGDNDKYRRWPARASSSSDSNDEDFLLELELDSHPNLAVDSSKSFSSWEKRDNFVSTDYFTPTGRLKVHHDERYRSLFEDDAGSSKGAAALMYDTKFYSKSPYAYSTLWNTRSQLEDNFLLYVGRHEEGYDKRSSSNGADKKKKLLFHPFRIFEKDAPLSEPMHLARVKASSSSSRPEDIEGEEDSSKRTSWIYETPKPNTYLTLKEKYDLSLESVKTPESDPDTHINGTVNHKVDHERMKVLKPLEEYLQKPVSNNLLNPASSGENHRDPLSRNIKSLKDLGITSGSATPPKIDMITYYQKRAKWESIKKDDEESPPEQTLTLYFDRHTSYEFKKTRVGTDLSVQDTIAVVWSKRWKVEFDCKQEQATKEDNLSTRLHFSKNDDSHEAKATVCKLKEKSIPNYVETTTTASDNGTAENHQPYYSPLRDPENFFETERPVVMFLEGSSKTAVDRLEEIKKGKGLASEYVRRLGERQREIRREKGETIDDKEMEWPDADFKISIPHGEKIPGGSGKDLDWIPTNSPLEHGLFIGSQESEVKHGNKQTKFEYFGLKEIEREILNKFSSSRGCEGINNDDDGTDSADEIKKKYCGKVYLWSLPGSGPKGSRKLCTREMCRITEDQWYENFADITGEVERPISDFESTTSDSSSLKPESPFYQAIIHDYTLFPTPWPFLSRPIVLFALISNAAQTWSSAYLSKVLTSVWKYITAAIALALVVTVEKDLFGKFGLRFGLASKQELAETDFLRVLKIYL